MQLFAKAKELAGGRDFLLCSLAAGDERISCQDFLDRYVFKVSTTAHTCSFKLATELLRRGLVAFLANSVTRAPCPSNGAMPISRVTRHAQCQGQYEGCAETSVCVPAQIEPGLEALRGSAFLAVNDEYVEPDDQLALKVSICMPYLRWLMLIPEICALFCLC